MKIRLEISLIFVSSVFLVFYETRLFSSTSSFSAGPPVRQPRLFSFGASILSPDADRTAARPKKQPFVWAPFREPRRYEYWRVEEKNGRRVLGVLGIESEKFGIRTQWSEASEGPKWPVERPLQRQWKGSGARINGNCPGADDKIQAEVSKPRKSAVRKRGQFERSPFTKTETTAIFLFHQNEPKVFLRSYQGMV